MTDVRAMTDAELQREYSAAMFFYNGTGTDGDSLEATMHREAEKRVDECEAELERRATSHSRCDQ